MTPSEWQAFLQVHSDLPRQGPGLPEDVAWALDHLDLSGPVRVFDAGCGPADDTVTLARLLPEAQITGVDTTQDFVDQAQPRIAPFDGRVEVRCDDMRFAPEGCELIWCAGALYFLGVTEGLTTWRPALAPGGHVAFSEPVLLDTPARPEVHAFWEEYPQITDLDGIKALVAAAGYRTHAHRMIVGAPWQAYYDPMQARIDTLRQSPADAALSNALDACQREIDLWRAAMDHVAYALLIVSPE
ncbi:class I SAM-dependent methyltransferase [uncultured Tateyamaria sp.]|uniref:class I SAM-dependent methyltransferase n=1 Tax=uncultured Tateyamaria sp. TaxID=455651 RepID=UPI002603A7F2|nr:class I SAM-dependent methyltransferase [uncultured Tateyamaria sp.]